MPNIIIRVGRGFVGSVQEKISKEYDGKVTPGKIREAYRRRKSGTDVPDKKPQRKQTDTETKIQLDNVAKKIKSGKVSDDDVKTINRNDFYERKRICVQFR